APPVHEGTAVGGAGARPDAPAPADRPRRRPAEPGPPAERLSLPHALPAGGGALPRRGAGPARDRARPLDGVSFRTDLEPAAPGRPASRLRAIMPGQEALGSPRPVTLRRG